MERGKTGILILPLSRGAVLERGAPSLSLGREHLGDNCTLEASLLLTELPSQEPPQNAG